MCGVTTSRDAQGARAIGERVIGGRRLDAEHVEPGAGEAAARQRRQQRRLVDQRAAPGVDQDRAGLERREERRARETARRIGERAVQRHHVGERQRLRQRHAVRRRRLRARRRGTAARTTFMPKAAPMRATAPPMCPLPTTTSVLPAELVQRLAEEREVGAARPGARGDVGRVARDVVVEVQDQREDQPRHRLAGVGRDVGDRDAARARRLEIDDVGAGRGHADVAQLGQRREQLAVDDDLVGEDRVRAGAALDALVGAGARVRGDLAAARAARPRIRRRRPDRW